MRLCDLCRRHTLGHCQSNLAPAQQSCIWVRSDCSDNAPMHAKIDGYLRSNLVVNSLVVTVEREQRQLMNAESKGSRLEAEAVEARAIKQDMMQTMPTGQVWLV